MVVDQHLGGWSEFNFSAKTHSLGHCFDEFWKFSASFVVAFLRERAHGGTETNCLGDDVGGVVITRFDPADIHNNRVKSIKVFGDERLHGA